MRPGIKRMGGDIKRVEARLELGFHCFDGHVYTCSVRLYRCACVQMEDRHLLGVSRINRHQNQIIHLMLRSVMLKTP